MDPTGNQPCGMAPFGQHVAQQQQQSPAPAYSSCQQQPQPEPQPALPHVTHLRYELTRHRPPGYIFTVNEVRIYQQFLQNIPQWDANTYLDHWRILRRKAYFSPRHQRAWADICASCYNLSRHFRVNAPPPAPAYTLRCPLPEQLALKLAPGYIFEVGEVGAYRQFFAGISQRDVDIYRDQWRLLQENDYFSPGHQQAWASICDICNTLSCHIRANAPQPPQQLPASPVVRLAVDQPPQQPPVSPLVRLAVEQQPPQQPSVSPLARLPVEILLMVVAECYKNRNHRACQPWKASPNPNHGRQLSGGVSELSQVNKFFNHVCAKYLFASACIKTSGADLEEAVLDYTITTSAKLAMDLVKTLSILKTEKSLGAGQGSASLPRSMVALAQLMPSLCELNLSLHRTAVPGLRQLLGSKTGTPMPTVKALRFMTESPVSLAFLAVAFPRLQTLSINVHHKGYRCTPWIIAKLSKLRYMKSLVTVQLFKLCWRHVDLREIQKCFPNVERLLLFGLITKDCARLTIFGDALAGLPKLRDLSLTATWSGLINDYRSAAEQETVGDCDLRWGGLGPMVIERSDIQRCRLAMDMFRHPGLAKLEVIGICLGERDCWHGQPIESRIYKAVKSPEGIIVGADAVRDYGHDSLREGGRGEFWVKGERALISRDRDWLTDEHFTSTSNCVWHL